MKRKTRKTLVKLFSFLSGAAVGAFISYLVTDKLAEKRYWDACDEELNKASLEHRKEVKGLNSEIDRLNAEISAQNVVIEAQKDKLIAAGLLKATESDDEDEESDRSGNRRSQGKATTNAEEAEERTYTAYRSMYGEGSTEHTDGYMGDPAESEYPEEEEEVDDGRPYIIDIDTLETTELDYPKLEWNYYIWDGKVLDEDNEWRDDYAHFIGEEWLEGHHKSGDKVYIRNDYYGNDYTVSFVAGYGEQHMSVSSTWEDD